LRLAETSQQPISQTTWLKVTPHWNPLYLYYDFSFSILFLFYIHLFRVSFSSCWDALWGIYSDVTLPYLTLGQTGAFGAERDVPSDTSVPRNRTFWQMAYSVNSLYQKKTPVPFES
jgi:hypothetical protein